LAEAIARTVECTIGMNRPIGDKAAIAFAAAFYEAIGFRRSLKVAYELGRNMMLRMGIAEHQTPDLLPREGIDASKLVLIAPKVTGQGSQSTERAPHETQVVGRPFLKVPPRSKFFEGREDVIAALRERLTEGGGTVLAQAITGLGGIGKTQTAVEYAYRYRDEYQAILWLNAESPLALKADFGELARRMQLPHPENDLDQAVAALKQWLATRAGWLLVFDNADDPAMLKPFLPDTEAGHILVTSRAQDFQDFGIVNPVELEELSVEDATAFLLKRCGREGAGADERDAAERLARELDGLPLALEQAAAYIAAGKGLKIRSYLESYRTGGLKRLEARRPALGGYPRSVVSTWAANFELVQKESPAAVDVLRLSAFLAPDAIPFELLTGGARELGPPVEQALIGAVDPLLVLDLLRPLGRFSLIRIDGDTEAYSIHRLVQEVLKAAMDAAARRTWAERAVRAVNQAFPYIEYNNWPLCGRLLPHALAVASWIKRDGMEFAEAGRLLHQTASYLHGRGQYAEAEPLLKRAMEIRRTALGETHPDYATSLNNLAGLYDAMGRHGEAEPLYLRAMEIRRTALGEQHPRYATSLHNLAALYDAMGRHGEAEPLFKRAMEITRTALGEGHPDYATSLNNLAGLYDAMGRHGEAEPLYLRAMEIRRTALGETHPDYAASLNNLALLYYAMGRHAEAEPLLKQAMEIRRTALGEGHPDYAASLNNLAELYRAMGRHAEAEPLLKQAMELRRTALGEGHPDYAASLNNLGMLYVATSRPADAEPLLLRAADVYRTTLGERHPDYVTSITNLMNMYIATGRPAEAESLRQKGLGT
jgi:tetratricopeptide (TPR) repeat protein